MMGSYAPNRAILYHSISSSYLRWFWNCFCNQFKDLSLCLLLQKFFEGLRCRSFVIFVTFMSAVTVHCQSVQAYRMYLLHQHQFSNKHCKYFSLKKLFRRVESCQTRLLNRVAAPTDTIKSVWKGAIPKSKPSSIYLIILTFPIFIHVSYSSS